MELTASEQATLHFYNWEYRHRGYYHFETPIDIEVPYVPFHHGTYTNPVIDDGRVPTLFQQIGKLLAPPKKQEEPKQELTEVIPRFLEFSEKPNLVGFSLSFPKGSEINVQRNIEFLNMLSFTEHMVSFEIVGSSDTIAIQIVCGEYDIGRVRSQIQAYFPTAIVRDIDITEFGFNEEKEIAIADFGLNDEYMRSIHTTESFSIDPLTSVIATMESLQGNEVAVLQILFKGITSPLAKDTIYAVSDGAGGSFFSDSPEMPICAKDKISNPLFSVVMRMATQGENNRESQYLAQELARSITSISQSQYNKLIPLSNEGYDYDFHTYNLHHRLSNRLGFILNSKELNTFVHYPNKTLVSQKLGIGNEKTKYVPQEAIKQKYILGINTHNGIETNVTLNDEMRLRHTHIIGATGVGKSTLIANMMIEDMNAGNGCTLFDPHGDIVEDVLLRIPQHRKDDVIVIDPSDEKFSIGFNLLNANSDIEKIVLGSDLVNTFRQHATAWGDNMTAVLSNAINTFLESSKGGTLIELKRFLLEDAFRQNFLKYVNNPSFHYYWNNEYPIMRKGISPLLTRIDTFLRPKTIRCIMAQKTGVDFQKSINEKKIILIKLSQGLIGEENSYILGSLFLSKLNQVTLSRQNIPQKQRHPYYIYCDEFQNFITPNVTKILSSARKYGLGLILAHQELGQIDDTKILNSVISNPHTRVCFRLGDIDAKKLESGFSFFDTDDLQSLGTGQAIIRIGSSNKDCNISTFPLPKVAESAKTVREYVIDNTRKRYATPREEVEEILESLLPKIKEIQKEKNKDTDDIKVETKTVQQDIEVKKEVEEKKKTRLVNIDSEVKEETSDQTDFEKQKENYLKQAKEQETLRKHRSIQNFIRTIAHQRGYRVHLEEELPNGQRVDVGLVKNDIRIAIEVAVSNSNSYEVKNIQKCITHGYQLVYLVSESEVHLKNIKKEVSKTLNTQEKKRVFYIKPDELVQYLDIPTEEDTKAPPKRVKGWRIDVNYHPDDAKNMPSKNIASKLKNLLKKKK
ncbi:AAA-like domain-containing protein [Tenacibaculum sp. 190524A02b]|uniref:type IV secretory system conjugative DNA transfer family protein n=1 Tax=Tenacibaculum vairaonense TaxID=3137860 RepID=UPI0032B12C7A